MAALQLRLPKMVVCIHKPGGDDFASAVDEFRIDWDGNALSNLGDPVILHKDVGIPQGFHTVLVTVVEKSATPQKDSTGSGSCDSFGHGFAPE